MARRPGVIVVLGGVVVALGAAAALRASDGPSTQAEAPRAGGGATLQQQVAAEQAEDEAVAKLPPAEQERRLQARRTQDEQEQQALIEATLRAEATAPPVDSCPYRGVLSLAAQPGLPMPFHARQFVVSNYWGGVVDGACLGVYAGFDPAHPLRGELVIWNLNEPGPWRFYPTPSATGPVAIVAEANGVLRLSSLKGTYYTTPGVTPQVAVEAPGGGSYTFDLSSRQYR